MPQWCFFSNYRLGVRNELASELPMSIIVMVGVEFWFDLSGMLLVLPPARWHSIGLSSNAVRMHSGRWRSSRPSTHTMTLNRTFEQYCAHTMCTQFGGEVLPLTNWLISPHAQSREPKQPLIKNAVPISTPWHAWNYCTNMSLQGEPFWKSVKSSKLYVCVR